MWPCRDYAQDFCSAHFNLRLFRKKQLNCGRAHRRLWPSHTHWWCLRGYQSLQNHGCLPVSSVNRLKVKHSLLYSAKLVVGVDVTFTLQPKNLRNNLLIKTQFWICIPDLNIAQIYVNFKNFYKVISKIVSRLEIMSPFQQYKMAWFIGNIFGEGSLNLQELNHAEIRSTFFLEELIKQCLEFRIWEMIKTT